MNIKKILFAIMALLISASNVQAELLAKTDKTLVIYYSQTGNTQEFANQIHKIVEGDIARLETINAYPEDYKTLTKQAKQEIAEGYKPALKTKIENIASYDTIYIGTPIWWGTMAPPVATFLSENDLSGKKVVVFVTHGGGGMSRCTDDVKKILPNSTVIKGLSINGKNAKDGEKNVAKWLKGLQND